jgi:hypothetical protein
LIRIQKQLYTLNAFFGRSIEFVTPPETVWVIVFDECRYFWSCAALGTWPFVDRVNLVWFGGEGIGNAAVCSTEVLQITHNQQVDFLGYGNMARSTNPMMSRSAALSWFTAIFLKSSAKASSSSKLLLELMIALFFPSGSKN